MTGEEFQRLRAEYDVIPFVREMSADAITPVAAFAALSPPGTEAFLFESVERGENVGRYSFVGFEPRRSLRLDKSGDPVATLNRELVPLRVYGEERLPPFFGGAVGYFGYGVGGWTERIPDSNPDDLGLPDAKLLFFDNVVVFDHVRQRLFVIANVFSADENGSVEDAERRLDRAIELLRGARLELLALASSVAAKPDSTSNLSREEFESMISAAKEEIAAGEIFQIVLSQRWEAPFAESDALTLYRVLRSLNPSPYMFLLRTEECTLVGASPEMLVRVTRGRAEARPIAGTRPRGKTPQEDLELEAALLADPKENAEHLMLVDLGRNDLGRVCRSGSVEVTKFQRIERYSHVMHIVSDVEGLVRPDRSPVDVFLSCFPAGTVSGAPKIRAMELIDVLEPVRRGPYAGSVAYVGFSGNLDSCITIRTIVLARGRAFVQAGAGIVYDSDPAREWEETVNKSAALREAVAVASAIVGKVSS